MQTFNALFLMRVVFKFLVERLKEDEVLRQIEAKATGNERKGAPTSAVGENGKPAVEASESDSSSRLEDLVQALVELVSELPVTCVTTV